MQNLQRLEEETEEEAEGDDDDDEDEKEEQIDMRINTRHVVTQYVITTYLRGKFCPRYSPFPGYDALKLGNWFPAFRHNVDLIFKVRDVQEEWSVCMSFRSGLSACMLIVDTGLDFVTDHKPTKKRTFCKMQRDYCKVCMLHVLRTFCNICTC